MTNFKEAQEKRKSAMEWWNNLSDSERQEIAHMYSKGTIAGYLDRPTSSFTGREIETIYKNTNNKA